MSELGAGAASETHRVLLVEDGRSLAEWVSHTLAEAGIAVTVCADSRAAVERATQLGPTLILQDLMMPQIGGFELLERYRALPALADVPVIVLSGISDVHEKCRAFELGAADYLVKIPHPIELVARVRAQSRAYLVRRERDELHRELQRTMQMLTESNLRLQRAAREDGLTGLANRRAFDEALEREWRRAQREQKPVSLALIDIDSFKLFNDHYGHLRGDTCLCSVASVVMSRARRPADLAARYGGEELALLLPGILAEGARAVGEGVRHRIAALELPHEARVDGVPWVTASVGVATLVPPADQDPSALIEAADHALYAAKRAGKNRVVHALLDR